LLLLFSTATPPPSFHTLSLHDALPILLIQRCANQRAVVQAELTQPSVDRPVRNPNPPRDFRGGQTFPPQSPQQDLYRRPMGQLQDRKSTRLNSSHVSISYAVFCLKKKK